AGMEDERMIAVHLDELRQLLLLDLDVDERVAVVVKDPEDAVDADVHARRLEERLVVRIDLDASFNEVAGDRRVREDHAAILRGTIPAPRGNRLGHRLQRASPLQTRGAQTPDPPAPPDGFRRARAPRPRSPLRPGPSSLRPGPRC